MNIIFKEDCIPEMDAILKLYNDVGWTAYTDNSEELLNAINHSLKVWTVWDEDSLIGLARVVGDGYTIIYIQDILILNKYQGKGIGSKLIKLILEECGDIRGVVLLTEDSEKTIGYYTKNGLTDVRDLECTAFTKQEKQNEMFKL